MHELDTALALLGLVMLLLGATSGLVKSRWYVSEPVLALAVGIVAGPCTGLLRVPPDAFGFLEQACPPSLVRAVLNGEKTGDSDLAKKIADMGWTATVIPEEHGGLGLSYYELCVIAEEMGRAVVPTSFSSSSTA